MQRIVKRKKKSRRPIKESEVSVEESSLDEDKKTAKKKNKVSNYIEKNQNNSGNYSINMFFQEN